MSLRQKLSPQRCSWSQMPQWISQLFRTTIQFYFIHKHIIFISESLSCFLFVQYPAMYIKFNIWYFFIFVACVVLWNFETACNKPTQMEMYLLWHFYLSPNSWPLWRPTYWIHTEFNLYKAYRQICHLQPYSPIRGYHVSRPFHPFPTRSCLIVYA